MACRSKLIIFFITFLLIFSIFNKKTEASNLRVISLYPGHSDNIYALGGKDFLIALSENDDNDLLPELPRISLRTGPEKILALEPDVIITRSFAEKLNPNLYNILSQSGIKILVIDPPEWDNFPEYLKTLANFLNLNPDKAIKKLENIKKEISIQAKKEISSGKKIPNVFLEATAKELHTCSANSWASHLISLAGGNNIAKDSKPLRTGSSIATWGIERVLKSLDNGLDVYIIQRGAMNRTEIKDFYSRHWSGILKNKNIKVQEIPEKYLSRPSLLGLENGGKELLKIFWNRKEED